MSEVTRTCVGCRTRHPQAELLRLRRRSDGAVIWAGTRPTGRSAYLCPSRACVDAAEKRRAFSRAFRGHTVKGGPREAVAAARIAIRQALAQGRSGSPQTSVRVARLEALSERLTDVVAPSPDPSTHFKGGHTHG